MAGADAHGKVWKAEVEVSRLPPEKDNMTINAIIII